MNAKVMMLLVLVSVMVGSSFSAPQFGRPGGLIGLRRPGGFQGRPVFGPGFGGANAAGLGSGTVIGNQAIGTGTGIANAGPGGFGIGLGIGAGVATPIGNFGIGQGNSISVGK
ncbi:ATP-dependent RNA helicase glh-2 [Daphnia magna]|uniref:Uncharacterized protein n=1 Tax=Daphnia magna TaxID=35525 RepID=A0ABR0B209_9CRUS|nr:ATP-dependent RNA helicase glh-2 [Daphnia magna]KAK4035733.1 hypothetical protein OUZ56_027817 [Daphnia magna]